MKRREHGVEIIVFILVVEVVVLIPHSDLVESNLLHSLFQAL